MGFFYRIVPEFWLHGMKKVLKLLLAFSGSGLLYDFLRELGRHFVIVGEGP